MKMDKWTKMAATLIALISVSFGVLIALGVKCIGKMICKIPTRKKTLY